MVPIPCGIRNAIVRRSRRLMQGYSSTIGYLDRIIEDMGFYHGSLQLAAKNLDEMIKLIRNTLQADLKDLRHKLINLWLRMLSFII